MGILVSWIRTIWIPAGDSQVTPSPDDADPLGFHAPTIDPQTPKACSSLSDDLEGALIRAPIAELSVTMKEPDASLVSPAPTLSRLDQFAAPLPSLTPTPPSPRVSPLALPFSAAVDREQQVMPMTPTTTPRAMSPEPGMLMQMPAFSGNSATAAPGATAYLGAIAKGEALQHAQAQAPLTAESGPPGLRIDVAAANDPGAVAMEREWDKADANFVSLGAGPGPSEDMCFDDEGLSALEKIYLFARSNASFHRVFIARSLPNFFPDVSAQDAVEYVIPLMNGLAVDEDEAVREALAENLSHSIWWFFTHCQLVGHEVPENSEPRDIPLLYVQAFTPLLGTLLLNSRANIAAPARLCVVNLLARIRETDSRSEENQGAFVPEARRLFERELIQQVVIGMAHLDVMRPEGVVGLAYNEEGRATPQMHLSESRQNLEENLASNVLSTPPLSAADDEMLLPTLASSAQSLSTKLLIDQERSGVHLSSVSFESHHPPSPFPTSPPVRDSSHACSADAELKQLEPMDISPPASSSLSLQSVDERLRNEAKARSVSSTDQHKDMIAPTDALYDAEDFEVTEEQAAFGRLASMSLVAAITASVVLDDDSQLAFVEEVSRAGRDPVFWVRREATFALGALAKVVPEEVLYLTLIPLFENFCEDSIWNVRLSILFALPAILSRLPSEARKTQALKSLLKLSLDPIPQVRTGVLEILGEVIFSFHKDDDGPPSELVRLFIGVEGRDWHSNIPAGGEQSVVLPRHTRTNSLRQSHLSNASSEILWPPPRQSRSPVRPSFIPLPDVDPARSLVCAFNIPAVVLTLGAKRWSEVRGLYLHLARTGSTKVRQTLAASIGEIARIIGPDSAGQDLIRCWWDFVCWKDSAVRLKALEALEGLVCALHPSDQIDFTRRLEEAWDDHLKGWREREELAKRLARLAFLLPANGETLLLLLRRALRDEMAAVRNAAVEAFPSMIGHLSLYPQGMRLALGEVHSLAYDQSFRKRLTFVKCMQSLLSSSNDSYIKEQGLHESLWKAVTTLASDTIVDVRIGVARLMSTAFELASSRSSTLPLPLNILLEFIHTLAEDASEDVRSFVNHLDPSLPGHTRVEVHVNGKNGVNGTVQGIGPSATFSRPPTRRYPGAIAEAIGGLKLADGNGAITKDKTRTAEL